MNIEDNPIIKKRIEQLGIKSISEYGSIKFPKLHIPGEEPFVCPDCRKQFKVNDAVVIQIQTESKHIGTEFHGRIVERKYRDTYYNVRFCSCCAKKRKMISKISLMILFVIIPLSVAIWSISQPGRGVGSFLGALFGTEFLCLVAYGIWNWMTMGSSIDIDEAAKNNALAPNDLFLH